jgi:single-strand DNA-binding protein
MNKHIICGNLGADVETKVSTSGKSWAKLSVATHESWINEKGEKVTQTEWHQVVCFGSLAEACGKYLKKGAQVLVEGKVVHKKWTDDEGVQRSSCQTLADSVKFL